MQHDTLLKAMALERERAALVEFLARTARDETLRVAPAYGAEIRMPVAVVAPIVRARMDQIVGQLRELGVEIDG
jgi:hypothetical protein